MTDPIFPTGIRVFEPHENAPDFVKGTLSIETNKFCAWLGQQPEPTVRLDIKKARNGKWYLQLNTWKPNKAKDNADTSDGPQNLIGLVPRDIYHSSVTSVNDDIPF